MLRNEIKDSVVRLLSKHGAMRLRDIFRTLKKEFLDAKYINVEVVVRANTGENALFERISQGTYQLRGKCCNLTKDSDGKRLKKKVFAIRKKEIGNKKVQAINGRPQELKVEDHLGYLKGMAIKFAKTFGLEVGDMFSEAIFIAYSVKSRYDPNKGAPTTFLLNDVGSRLKNKITRELIPNIFKMVDVKQEDGTIKRQGKRILINNLSLNAKSSDSKFTLEGILCREIVPGRIGESSDRPDVECEGWELAEKVKAYLENSRISERDLNIVKRKFGLDGGPERTMDEVGGEVSLSKERVRQILEKAYTDLRADENFKGLAG